MALKTYIKQMFNVKHTVIKNFTNLDRLKFTKTFQPARWKTTRS